MVVRTRRVTDYSTTGVYRAFSGPILATKIDYACYLNSPQKVISDGHPFHLLRRKVNSLDIGGSFDSWKVVQSMGNGSFNITNGPKTSGSWYSYDGPLFAHSHQSSVSSSQSLPFKSESQMNALGTTGIARAIPTNPLSGMGQFLGELRDLPKAEVLLLAKRKARDFRRLARDGSSDYLNAQFGWIPFVKDLIEFGKVVKHSDERIREYARDSGRVVRRRRHISSDSSTSVTNNGSAYALPSLNVNLQTSPGNKTTTIRTTTDSWFSGAFTYYLPPPSDDFFGIDGHKRAEALLAHLYGLRVTPELVWQLAPWSWGVDWLTNVGDVVHNWSAFQNDGLVMKYGYVMCTQRTTTTYSLTGLTLSRVGKVNLTQFKVETTKQRRKATPYGFGLDPGLFSPRQWSIIAALGISKAPRSLNF